MDPASVFNQIREILCFRVHLEGILSRRHGSSAFVGYSVLASMDLVHLGAHPQPHVAILSNTIKMDPASVFYQIVWFSFEENQ